MAGEREVTVDRDVACPRCAQGPHPVRVVATLSRGQLLFGGPGADTTVPAVVTLRCPASGLPFEATVDVPAKAGEQVRTVRLVAAGRSDGTAAVPPPHVPVGATTEPTAEAAGATTEPTAEASPSVPPPAPAIPAGTAADWRTQELAEWRRGSPGLARDAGSKLLAASTAAVGAYFTVLKYVSGDDMSGWRLAVSVLPAVGFLGVAVLSALVLRPMLARVHGPEDFEALRELVLHRQDRLISHALSLFVSSTILASVALVAVWS